MNKTPITPTLNTSIGAITNNIAFVLNVCILSKNFILKPKVKEEPVKWRWINRHRLWLYNHWWLDNHRRIIRGNSVISKMWIYGSVIIIKTKAMLSFYSRLLSLRLLPLLLALNLWPLWCWPCELRIWCLDNSSGWSLWLITVGFANIS